MSKIMSFFEKHPYIAMGIAAGLVWGAIENYVVVSNWVYGIEQIKASESLGG